MNLRDLVLHSAQVTPDAIAVDGFDGCLSYGELDRLANRFAHALKRLGVQPGDRVGIWLEKSGCGVAAMQGILRLNAIYVPLDPQSPLARVKAIVQDCQIGVLVTSEERAQKMQACFEAMHQLDLICVNAFTSQSGVGWRELIACSTEAPVYPASDENDMAYILYTSGSTGVPKGVCLSHSNALAFIEWAQNELQAQAQDRFANHAPFHFDLSVFDLYVAFSAGATVLLIPEGSAYLPTNLVEFVLKASVTVWYSVPSALMLMMGMGGLMKQKRLPMRAILFAGEPFPIKHLRRLYRQYPDIRFFNLYGPTETNVCTFYEVLTLSDERILPVPIGRACSGDTVWVQREDGFVARPGEEGELFVSGPTVMLGYWGQDAQGTVPYATGDIVRLQEDGNYLYVGRRDHLVKVRGYRVELGDIESILMQHVAIRENCVLVEGVGMEARLVAYVVCYENQELTLLDLKRFCAERLPRYMIVDRVHVLPDLPRTRNGKIDRRALLEKQQSSSLS